MPSSRERIVSLQKRNTNRLYEDLARSTEHLFRSAYFTEERVTRHHTTRESESHVHAKRSSGSQWVSNSRFSRTFATQNAGRVDVEMLKQLSSALGKTHQVRSGEEILDTLWERVKEQVCEEWDICEKFVAGNVGLMLGLYSMMMRGQPRQLSDLYMFVAVLAMRLGPEWMCDCSKRD